MTFMDFGINVNGHTRGQTATTCPRCSHERRITENPAVATWDALASTPIRLTKGYVAIIDLEDLPRVAPFKWQVDVRNTVVYAQRTWREGAKKRRQYLHRFIMQAPQGVEVDHKNGNGLDCRKDNMRLVTHQQNAMNRGRCAKGVRYHQNRWQAYIKKDQKQIHLGCFTTQAEAVQAREKAIELLFGDMDARKEERNYDNLG